MAMEREGLFTVMNNYYSPVLPHDCLCIPYMYVYILNISDIVGGWYGIDKMAEFLLGWSGQV